MQTKDKLLIIWLCSAAIVTLARVFNAAELGELPIQIQAGQNVLAGKGLTVYSSPGEDDLAQPAHLVTLAHFPAGFSLYEAALMAMGASVATSVKLYFAITTLLGWLGWGFLANYFFAEGLRRGRGWILTAFVIAACTPLVYTMLWKGTDTFLWAAIPWVLCWITIASREQDSRKRWLDGVAGLLCGLAFLMRYAGIFLAVYAAVVILCQSAGRPKLLASRIGAFFLGLSPILILQIYLTYFSSNSEAIPDIFTLDGGVRVILNRLGHALPFLTAANIAIVWWMPHQLVEIFTRSAHQAKWLIALTILAWALLPALLIRKLEYRDLFEASRDVRIVAVGFLVTMPLFLLAWSGVADYIYVLEPRYYLVLLPMLVFVAYQLAIPTQPNDGRFGRWARMASLIYLAGYVCMAVISVVRLAVPGEIGKASRVKLMALSPDRWHWPSNKTTYDFLQGRNYVVGLLRDNPETVLVTNHEEWFYAAPDIDRSRIRRPKDLRATYVAGPARIVTVIQDHDPGPLTRVAWFGHYDQRWVADYFEGFPEVRLLRTFPDEQIRVVEAVIPNGERIALKRETARMKNL